MNNGIWATYLLICQTEDGKKNALHILNLMIKQLSEIRQQPNGCLIMKFTLQWALIRIGQ